MHTRLLAPEVSPEHAVIAWDGASWVLRDLGSTNGTQVDGTSVAPNTDVPLRVGQRLRFGGSEPALVFSSDEPPRARAIASGRSVEAHDGVLTVPSPSAPVRIARGQRGWERADGAAPTLVSNGQDLVVDGVRWVLDLPEPLAPTVRAAASVDDLSLSFRVSNDEEYVEVDVHLPRRTVSLTPRAHHYTIVLLARQWCADARDEVPEAERGWVRKEDMVAMLQMAVGAVNLGIHRFRREVAELGVADAASVIQRRSTTGQLRLHARAVRVGPL